MTDLSSNFGVQLDTAGDLPPPSRFDDDIHRIKARLDAEDAGQTSVGLLGSSSFLFWDRLAEDVGSLQVRNLGFGGATIRSARLYVPMLFESYRPAKLIVQLGENDLVNDAATAVQTAVELTKLVQELRGVLSGIPIILLSAKISPARLAYAPLINDYNGMQEEFCRGNAGMSYVDMSACLLGPNALPAHRYFRPDLIHLNHEGYARWAALLKDLVRL